MGRIKGDKNIFQIVRGDPHSGIDNRNSDPVIGRGECDRKLSVFYRKRDHGVCSIMKDIIESL